MRPFVVLLFAAVLAGCASADKTDHASVQAVASATGLKSGTSLYDLPEMRSGRTHRERGATVMASAYIQPDPLQRENCFATAWKEFIAAEDDYHAALVVAPNRFHPVIDAEIRQVAEYVFQIQRDRAPPKN
jgi:hypothetical protein